MGLGYCTFRHCYNNTTPCGVVLLVILSFYNNITSYEVMLSQQ